MVVDGLGALLSADGQEGEKNITLRDGTVGGASGEASVGLHVQGDAEDSLAVVGLLADLLDDGIKGALTGSRGRGQDEGGVATVQVALRVLNLDVEGAALTSQELVLRQNLGDANVLNTAASGTALELSGNGGLGVRAAKDGASANLNLDLGVGVEGLAGNLLSLGAELGGLAAGQVGVLVALLLVASLFVARHYEKVNFCYY